MAKKVEDFIPQARLKYQENVEFEIRKIAHQLLEDHEYKEKKIKQDNCPHLKTSSYNHGYHEICNECGKEVN